MWRVSVQATESLKGNWHQWGKVKMKVLLHLKGEKNTHGKLKSHSSKLRANNIPRQQGHVAQQPYIKT